MDIQDQAQVAANPSLGRSSDDCSRQQAVLRKAVLRKAGMPGQDMSKLPDPMPNVLFLILGSGNPK
ncbi:hypothetical protein FOCG_18589 [Fusarium oxysporum f. sp. radicis-lycopersici 26381]|nr:hypothetical protein FOCG_18589 [Fusarium oxysporum f. sp. radicis-lycopersici 26381]